MRTVDTGNIYIYLTRLSRRLQLRDALSLVQRTIWAPVLAVLFVQVIGRFWPVENVREWSLTFLLIYTLSLVLFSISRSQTPLKVARRIDIELALKERLSTAVVLSDFSRSRTSPIAMSELIEQQNRDALSTAAAIDPRVAFSMQWHWQPLLITAVLAASVITLAFIPNPMDAILAEREAVAKAAQAEADRIAELHQEIAASDELSAEDREELLRLLQELAEALRQNHGDRAEALAEISRVEDAVRQRLDPNAGLRQAALDTLASQMRSLAGMQADEMSDLSGAAEALQKLVEQMADMTAAEKQALSQNFAQMAARAAQAGETDLAQALTQMAQAAASGDSQMAQQSAQKAAEAMNQSQADLASQTSIGQTLSDLQNSRQVISRAGQGQTIADAGQGDRQGDGQGDGGNDGQGQGQGDGQGQPGGGGGTDADTLPPGSSTGRPGDPTGQGRPSVISGQEPQVYTPWERRSEEGDPFYIPSQDTGEGETQIRERYDPFPGSPGQALVPYHEVFQTYMNVANQAIEQSYIPSSLKEFVMEYFSQLEP